MPMATGKIFPALHFDQATFGSGELEFQAATAVQLGNLHCGREYKVDATVVEFVDEVDEAPRRILSTERHRH